MSSVACLGLFSSSGGRACVTGRAPRAPAPLVVGGPAGAPRAAAWAFCTPGSAPAWVALPQSTLIARPRPAGRQGSKPVPGSVFRECLFTLAAHGWPRPGAAAVQQCRPGLDGTWPCSSGTRAHRHPSRTLPSEASTASPTQPDRATSASSERPWSVRLFPEEQVEPFRPCEHSGKSLRVGWNVCLVGGKESAMPSPA